MLVHSARPEDLEMPVEGFGDYITPIERFFVRTHVNAPMIDVARAPANKKRKPLRGMVIGRPTGFDCSSRSSAFEIGSLRSPARIACAEHVCMSGTALPDAGILRNDVRRRSLSHLCQPSTTSGVSQSWRVVGADCQRLASCASQCLVKNWSASDLDCHK
jgi:hypothetical protein